MGSRDACEACARYRRRSFSGRHAAISPMTNLQVIDAYPPLAAHREMHTIIGAHRTVLADVLRPNVSLAVWRRGVQRRSQTGSLNARQRRLRQDRAILIFLSQPHAFRRHYVRRFPLKPLSNKRVFYHCHMMPLSSRASWLGYLETLTCASGLNGSRTSSAQISMPIGCRFACYAPTMAPERSGFPLQRRNG